MTETVLWVLGIVWVVSFASYLVPQLLLKLRSVQNLKDKYGAKWALVTGGSSGIGRAIVETLAGQGLNVVVVAMQDKVLDTSVEEYKKAFPSVEFRKVGVDLSSADRMQPMREATKDIDVQVIVNNAGYIKTGFFAETPFGAQLANHNVNATAAMEVAHHYISAMRAKGLKGCVTFTSSPAGFMPCPFSVMYGATKAYLTTFAQSLAPELRCDGIDVCVVHPSPVASSFYDNTHALDALLFFKSTATGPQTIANILLANVGRAVTIDQGYYPICVKLLLKVLDVNFLAETIASVAHFMPDFKAMKSTSSPKKVA